ncbi:hypothetical protein [Chitinophaga sp. YR627]|uniref:hypothetical protein n=1 Tax=Chitinophaga sp. YR627 TaxID=1881041 RepID=UPI000B7E3D2C|nr:hypothetical protein [Chitinophaga sp. YR627]
MALQTSIFPFTGRLGNMIGYRRNGKYYLRSMPQKVRQTKATRSAAKRFGIASKRGALLRRSIYGELDISCDSTHVTRLTAALVNANVNNLTNIPGFRFNAATGISHFFAVTPVFTEDGYLHIPAQTLPQLKGIHAWDVKVIATRIDFKKHQAIATDIDGITIDPREPFTGATLSVSVPGKGTLVVVLQVQACRDEHPSQHKQHMAADIIAIQEPESDMLKSASLNRIAFPATKQSISLPIEPSTPLYPVQRE